MIAGVFQYYLHLAAGGQGLAANPIADGLVPFLAGLGFIALLLGSGFIQLPAVLAPYVDLAHLAGSLTAWHGLQAEEDLLEAAIPLVGGLFQHAELLPVLRLILPNLLGAAALGVELAAIQLLLAVTQYDALGQRHTILARCGRGADQWLPTALLQAVTIVIAAGRDGLACRHHLLAAEVTDLPALLNPELRLAADLLRQSTEVAIVPVEAAIDAQLLIGGIVIAGAELVGDFGDAIAQLAARFTVQPVCLPVGGGVIGQRRGGEQARCCQKQQPCTQIVHFYPFG